MTKKLYVGGLPYSTTNDELKELFSQVGTVVSAVIIMDRATGRSKGFGFVEVSSEEEMQKAIEMFDGKEYNGRNLTVNEARPLEERPKRSNFSRRDDRSPRGNFSRRDDRSPRREY